MSATWPSDWSERLRGKGCPMCSPDRPDEDEYGIRILAGRYSDAYLQRASWQLGYTIVMWRGRHVAEPTELREEEASGYWLEVLRVASALQRHYRPVKLNYQTLGNAVPHLHTHLVPRFAHDPRPAVRSRSPRGSGGACRRTRCAGMRSRCGPWSDGAAAVWFAFAARLLPGRGDWHCRPGERARQAGDQGFLWWARQGLNL